jgi:trans-2,3-dihydro-3-hydroxyanthranilate isomerase
MSAYAFETVDVFTERRYGGNPLAVFKDARGLKRCKARLNLSGETTFVPRRMR